MWFFLFLISMASATPKVAVSYFENNSKDPAMEPLKKGLADAMISSFATSKEIKVVERDRLNDVIQEIDLQKNPYFDKNSASQMGRGLGADFIVTGSYTVMGNDLRLSTRMVDVESSEIVASADSNGPKDTVWALQADVASKILEGLGSTVNVLQKKSMTKGGAGNFAAFSSYSKGVSLQDEGKADEARAAFEAAISADPNFSKAQVNIEDALAMLNEADAMAELAVSEFGTRVKGLIGSHKGGDPAACGQLQQLIQEEMRVIKMSAMGQFMKEQQAMMAQFGDKGPSVAGMMGGMLGGQAGGADTDEEIGEREYRLVTTGLAMSKMKFQDVMAAGPNGIPFKCNPQDGGLNVAQAMLLEPVTKIVMAREGMGDPPTLLMVDNDGNAVSERQHLEWYAYAATALYKLDPSKRAYDKGTLKKVLNILQGERLPEGQRKGAATTGIFDALASDIQSGAIKFKITTQPQFSPRKGISVAGKNIAFETARNLYITRKQFPRAIKSMWFSCRGGLCEWTEDANAPELGSIQSQTTGGGPIGFQVRAGMYTNVLKRQTHVGTKFISAEEAYVFIEGQDGRVIRIRVVPLKLSMKEKLLGETGNLSPMERQIRGLKGDSAKPTQFVEVFDNREEAYKVVGAPPAQ